MNIFQKILTPNKVQATLSMVAIFSCLSGINPAFALNKPTVVIFCASWNATCSQALPIIESNINSYGNKISYYELDIDESSTPNSANSIGVSMPRTIPYIAVVDKNGKTVYQGIYNNNTINSLNEILNELIK